MLRHSSNVAIAIAVTLCAAAQFSLAIDKSAATPSPRRSTVNLGGIAGNQPYFYQGATGQAWAARNAVGFRQIPFQTRIVSGGGHRHFYVSPYFRYGAYYGNDCYRFNDNWYDRRYPGFGYSVYTTGAYQPAPVIERRTVIVQAPVPAMPVEPVTDGWALLSAGDLAQAVGQFALDASRGDRRANVGYSIASALYGEQGQAVWAMRKAVSDLGAGIASVPTGQAKAKVAMVLAKYEALAQTRKSADVFFMLAALRLIDGDTAGTRTWLTRAREAGDDSGSAKALATALEK